MTGHLFTQALRAAYFAMPLPTEAVLLRFGLMADQFVLLWELSRGIPFTQKELSERTHSDPNSLRPMHILLERKELVDRRSHPTDGRARGVFLTTKEKKVLEKLWLETEPVRLRLFGTVAPRNPLRFLAHLKKIVASMDHSAAENSEISFAKCP